MDGRPLRVLQVVGAMRRGGTETWLMHVLRHIDRRRFQLDFLVHTTEPQDYDAEIRALGGEVIPCLGHAHPWTYARYFRRVLQEHGPYDVVHSHVHHYSGYVLRLAHAAQIPARIAHSHLDSSRIWDSASVGRRAYLQLTRRWIDRHATFGLAASREAAAALFGHGWEGDPRRQILYCGIDLSPFRSPVDLTAVRTGLGIPTDAFVIGHVGRFEEQKNHPFLVQVAAEVVRREPSTRLLLVGAGPLRPEIEQQVERAGISERVVFAGSRSDVAQLMQGAMDVFLFPSLYEGLGLALVEAQAAGLPCVVAEAVPTEADVVKDCIDRVALARPATVWAEQVLAAGRDGRAPRSEALALVMRSPFNIQTSVMHLTELYASQAIDPAHRDARVSA